MKNFVQFVLAVFAALVFGLGWPILWAEIALAVFAVLAVNGDSRRIAILEVIIPIFVIILFHHKPDLWLICLAISGFLAVWNITETVTALKIKLK